MEPAIITPQYHLQQPSTDVKNLLRLGYPTLLNLKEGAKIQMAYQETEYMLDL